MSPPADDASICGIPSCGKNVTGKTGGISCAQCLRWFHGGCVDVTTEQLSFLHKTKGKFKFTCTDCEANISEVSVLKEDVRKSNKSIEEVRKSNESIEAKLDALLSKNSNYDNQINNLIRDVTDCNKRIEQVDDKNSKTIKQLEDKNEILQKRFNRPDIIINGLPRKDIKLKEIVLQTFGFLGVRVTDQDLNVCCYINNRNSVLIKFNSLIKRDVIMKEYFKKGKLSQDDILKNDKKEQRIYLNDHLTEKGGKLCRLCRDLRRDQIIAKFRILNSDLPRVKIHFKDTSEKIFEFEECFKYFDDLKRQQLAENADADANTAQTDEDYNDINSAVIN